MNNDDFREAHDGVPEFYLYKYCTSASYVLALLTKGLNFPLENTGIEVTGDINGVDASWALGSVIVGANSIAKDILTPEKCRENKKDSVIHYTSVMGSKVSGGSEEEWS